MSKEDLKEIIRCLVDGGIVRSDYKVSKKSTDRLIAILWKAYPGLDLDDGLIKAITINPQLFSFYGITIGERYVRYNGKIVFYTF